MRTSLVWYMPLLVLLVLRPVTVLTQGIGAWSPPAPIPGYTDTALTPYLVPDQSGNVHAFTSDWVDEEDPVLAVVYRRWSLREGWTTPVDILLPPRGQARVQGALFDLDGFLHVVFWAGTDRDASIYYSKAPAISANRAQAWTPPLLIGDGAVAPDAATVIGDGSEHLAVVYSGNLDGSMNGLYVVFSNDGGETWGEPQLIFPTYSTELWPIALQAYVQSSNNMAHVVWSVANVTGNSEAVYYGQINLVDHTWTEPIILSQAIDVGFETDTPAVIEHDNSVFVIYHYDSPTTRWMRRSFDGGLSWTQPVRLFPHIGSNGPASMVVDSAGTLYMFFGNRLGEHPADHGIWYSRWQDGSWTFPQAIVSGKQRDDFDPSFARAAISQGNVVLVAWMNDPGLAQRGTFYSFATVDAPAIPLIPLPRPSPEIVSELAPSQLVTPPGLVSPMPASDFSDPRARSSFVDPPQQTSMSPLMLILWSVIPSVVIVLIFVGWRWLRPAKW